MKRINNLIAAVALCATTSAQYTTTLLDFAGAANGSEPLGSLISDGIFLYGMTQIGGTNDKGVIFKIKPDGTGDTILLNFTGANGSYPFGSLISDGAFLYGTTYYGGTNDWGVIFKIKPDGTGDTILLNFTDVNGRNPVGSLIFDGTFLYGMTFGGGTNGYGVIFKINPDGTGDTTLFNFTDPNGREPFGSLISDGTFLYGMTSIGGTNDKGVIFKIKPDGTGYSKLLAFAGTSNGANPYGSLISDGTFLYGMTSYGGTNSSGVIFKIKPDGTGYSKLLDFAGTSNGLGPWGSLISDGTFLYGMTPQGGTNNEGVIFKIKPDGTGYAKLLDFTGGTDGSNTHGSLIYNGTFLYGMTEGGGANNIGTVFKCYPISVSSTMVGNPICSNQCNGSASASVSGGTSPFTYSWNTSPVQTTETATGLCAATYSVTVSDSIGSASSTVTIISLPQPSAPSICAVTVDSLSLNNIILWDKTSYTNVDSFIIYREITTNNYQPIGAVAFDSLSMFIDTVRAKYFPYTGDPNAGTYRYKLAIRDTCGNYSAKGPYHNTIYTTNNSGTFSWNFYSIENTSNPVTGYILMRDDNSTGNWNAVQGVSGTQQTVTDPNYSTYHNTALWRVETQWSISCTPTLIKTTTYNTSRSNITGQSTTSVAMLQEQEQISISPNPTSEKFQISCNRLSSIKIYNVLGEQIYASTNPLIINSPITIDLSGHPSGIYFVVMASQGQAQSRKLVILH